MFVIKNNTDRDIVLDDLRVILGPHKQIDLDRVAPRHLIESSPKLRLAFQYKKVVTISMDGAGIGDKSDESRELQEMEARLKEDFRKQLVALNRQQTVTPSHDNTKLEELTATIQTLMKQMAERDRQTVQVVTVNQESKPDEACPDSTGDGISDDISTRLHAKTMQRLEKKVTGASNVDHESKKTRNDISTNIDELENML